jgi:hypothetical protein
MANSTTTVETTHWSPEVAAYAAEQGVEDCLLPHWEMTRRLFPNARRIEVFLEDDPEIANLRFIVFQVAVAGLDVSQAVELQHRWCDESLQCCPPPRNSPFVLGLELGT